MGKRKRTKHSPAADKGESPSPSRLLSLPPETRQMIWKAVIDTYQFLLDGKTYSQGAPMVVEILGYIARPLAEIDQTCRCPQSSKKPKIHLLDWLQTNRQIYAEAKPTVYGNLAIHICDALVFNAFLSLPRSAVLRPESIRSLTLCVKIEIEPGLRDGFSFVNGECHGWRTGHPRGLCCCPYCFAAGGEGNDLVARFSALRELRLRAYFTCHKIVGHFDSEAAQTGQLRQPRSPTPLVCVDDSERIEQFIGQIRNIQPLSLFNRRNIKSVDLEFRAETIEHIHPQKRCWCTGQSIDEESLRKTNIASRIEKSLMSGRGA